MGCHLTWVLGDSGVVTGRDRGKSVPGAGVVGQRSEAGGRGVGECGWTLGALGAIGESRGEGPEAAELSVGGSGLAGPGPRTRYFRQWELLKSFGPGQVEVDVSGEAVVQPGCQDECGNQEDRSVARVLETEETGQ